MKIVPRKLKVGKHRVGDVPKRWTEIYARISDEFARWAIKVETSRCGYYVVDGKPDPRVYSKPLGELGFSADGRAYGYDTSWRSGVIFNGKRRFGENTRDLTLYGSAQQWACRKLDKEGQWRLLSARGMHPGELCCGEGFTADGKHLVYLTTDCKIMCDDQKIFDGEVTECEISNTPPYASWIGSPAGEPKREYVYLLGRRKELLPAYYEVLTFTVSRDHRRYLYGAAEEEVVDRNNQFCGEQFAYIDGIKQKGIWQEVDFLDNEFSSDGRRVTYGAIDHNRRFHIILDGKDMGHFGACRGNLFSPNGHRHGFIAYDNPSGTSKVDQFDDASPRIPGVVVIDGRVFDPQSCVVPYTLCFSPDEKHFAFVGFKISHIVRKPVPHAVYLDGHCVAESDVCEAKMTTWGSKPQFSSDSRRLYFFSIEGEALFFNVVDVS